MAPTKIPDFNRIVDLTETGGLDIIESGKPTLEQLVCILNEIEKLSAETALILPNNFLYKLEPRIVKKNIRKLRLKRFYTQREAIESQVCVTNLIEEKINELKECYTLHPESLCDNYAGINYRGITDKKNRNYFITDAIDGFIFAYENKDKIEMQRYDTLEELLQGKESKNLSTSVKAQIFREIKKIRHRDSLSKKVIELPAYLREIIITKQAERVMKVPSRSSDKIYEIKFRKLPEAFPDDKFPELNKKHYAIWFDIYTEPSCTCRDKLYFINYLAPRELWFCFHEIAAFRAMILKDWREGQPDTYPNPYISSSPFFKPSKEAINLYKKLSNQLFVKVYEQERIKYKHLPRVYIEALIIKEVVRNKLNLF